MSGTTQDLTFSAALDAVELGIRSVKGPDLEAEEISGSTSLWIGDDATQPSLCLDSLDLLELVVFLEERFGWVIPEERIDTEGWRTVGDLAVAVVDIARSAPRAIDD